MKAQYEAGGYDFYVIKMDSNGNTGPYPGTLGVPRALLTALLSFYSFMGPKKDEHQFRNY